MIFGCISLALNQNLIKIKICYWEKSKQKKECEYKDIFRYPDHQFYKF